MIFMPDRLDRDMPSERYPILQLEPSNQTLQHVAIGPATTKGQPPFTCPPERTCQNIQENVLPLLARIKSRNAGYTKLLVDIVGRPGNGRNHCNNAGIENNLSIVKTVA